MANEVLLAALAIGAIFLVVKSGDSDKKKLNEKRSSDEGGGMSREEAARANPSEQETADRQTWLGRLQEVENEYGFLVDWESRNGALLQEKREFPVQIWNRIRKVRDRLNEIARVAKLIFDDKDKGADKNFWDRFNGMWNGTQKFWDVQQGLLKSKPIQAPSKSQPNHLATPVDGPTGMQIVEFQQSPQGLDVPKFSQADLIEYNRKLFNMLASREDKAGCN